MARFGRVVTAMVTPFTEDRSLDLDRAQELAAWLVDHGSDGLVVTGSTGESATLTDDEKISMWRAVAEAAGDRATVIAGTGTYDTAHSIHLSHEAEKAGVAGLLVVTPYYNKPPQRGLLEHFSRIAEATPLPILAYNIPGRTGLRIEHQTLLRMAEVENIVAVKDSTGDFDAIAHLIREAPDGFEVYSGDDWAIFGYVSLGAVGVVSVASHVVGERIRQMIEQLEAGDVASARKAHYELMPVFDALFITSNPIPLKRAMALIGQPVGPPRLPLVAANDDESARIEAALKEAGVL
ncbi:MAG TPA: 4-hydroxy-tetrahydrodipicolinate synthase [Actinomycetota bacterium]|nr:4-hydroxy-tetrahydrodipicolinate synthase [Actinomycetota bacterium]